MTTDFAVPRSRRSDRWREALNFGITVLPALMLSVILSLRVEELKATVQGQMGELAFWATLILIMNLIPFNEGERSFSLDTPILICVAILYPPAAACVVASLGSLDLREVFGRVSFSRAVFNRTQIGLCVVAAGFVFNAVTGGDLAPWTRGTIGTAVALVTFHGMNVIVVGAYTALRTHTSFREAVSSLTIGSAKSFLATYLGCGVLALVLAHLFREVGPWSVCLFLIPLVVARQMLVRGDELDRLARQLRLRERLLERLFDRIVEERRDERSRIATGLHDDVLQSLIRISQLGAFLRQALPDDGEAGRDAREMEQISRRTVESLRIVLSDLKRSPVGTGGLVASLRTLAADLQLDWRREIRVSAPEDLAIAPEVQIVTYQATREAIINALKHAAPNRVWVTCRRLGGDVVSVVQDDGVGFQPDLVDEAEHFGLGLMRRRVELAGGRVEVRSGLNEGTTISIRIPEVAGSDLNGPIGVDA